MVFIEVMMKDISEDEKKYIKTVYGAGYCLELPNIEQLVESNGESDIAALGADKDVG